MLLGVAFRRNGDGGSLNGTRLRTCWTSLGNLLKRDGEAEAAGKSLLWLWLARLPSSTIRPLPPLLLILQLHQPKPISQRIKTRASLEYRRRRGSRAGTRVRRHARLLTVLPAVEGLVAGVGRAGSRSCWLCRHGAAAGPAVGGYAAAC